MKKKIRKLVRGTPWRKFAAVLERGGCWCWWIDRKGKVHLDPDLKRHVEGLRKKKRKKKAKENP